MMDYPLRVHIAPVGYDIDRVVLPLKTMVADRVWLVKERNEREDKGIVYFQKVTDWLGTNLPQCDVKIETCALIDRDLYDILRTYRKIIEIESANHIFINVSTGTKIHSIAGMLVSMIFKEDKMDISPYYVVPQNYDGKTEDGGTLITGCKDIFPIPSYKIEKPRDDLVAVLKIIRELMQKNVKLTKNILIEELDKLHSLEIHARRDRSKQDEKSAKYRALDRKYIQPLINWNFIEVVGDGRRKEIRITPEGENILVFLG